jgi:hypothetical protein
MGNKVSEVLVAKPVADNIPTAKDQAWQVVDFDLGIHTPKPAPTYQIEHIFLSSRVEMLYSIQPTPTSFILS